MLLTDGTAPEAGQRLQGSISRHSPSTLGAECSGLASLQVSDGEAEWLATAPHKVLRTILGTQRDKFPGLPSADPVTRYCGIYLCHMAIFPTTYAAPAL